MDSKKKVITLILLVLGLVLMGTLGYMFLLNLGLVDALYMTVITISTVGYKEVADMTSEAKLFSMLLIIMSIGTVGYLVSNIVSFFLEGEVKEVWRRRKMENTIASLEDHYIICGAGETGIFVINQFKKQEIPFVVIDKSQELCHRLSEENINYVHGDATMDHILEKAGILRAKGLVASLGKDSENVYTVLTARQMNEHLHIVARSIDEHAHEKLIKAGANNAVSPNEIGGIRMAALVLKPSVVSFLDAITHAGDMVLSLEDVVIGGGSSVCDKTLMEASIPNQTGLIVLALNQIADEEKEMVFNPGPEIMLREGDRMIVLGRDEQIEKLRQMSRDSGKRLT